MSEDTVVDSQFQLLNKSSFFCLDHFFISASRFLASERLGNSSLYLSSTGLLILV